MPKFVAKTESALRPLPRCFEVPSLGDFAAGMPEDLLLCPVRALSVYLDRTSGIVNRPRRLFVSSKCPSRAMSKNGISYMLREVIVQSGASLQSGQVPRAHSIRGIATSSAFFRNWSLHSVLEAASWRSNTVFTSFFFFFKNTKNLFIHIARIPIGDSPRVHPNIFKMSPPFASSEGVSASGVRYQSDGECVTHLLPHS